MSSDGKNYLVSASCAYWGSNKTTSSFDVGDTTDGLKNDGGTLKAR